MTQIDKEEYVKNLRKFLEDKRSAEVIATKYVLEGLLLMMEELEYGSEDYETADKVLAAISLDGIELKATGNLTLTE